MAIPANFTILMTFKTFYFEKIDLDITIQYTAFFSFLTGPKWQTFKCVNCVNFTVNRVNSYCFSQFVSHFVVVISITLWPT